MANEARVTASLTINKSPIKYVSRPTSFNGTVTGTKGPVPGTISATPAGVSVDFSQLTTPGYCRLQNLDSTNYVSVGIWDGTTFYPLMEILAGESYVIRLHRDIGEEYGTGTGTTGTAANSMRIKSGSPTASVNVLIEAFET